MQSRMRAADPTFSAPPSRTHPGALRRSMGIETGSSTQTQSRYRRTPASDRRHLLERFHYADAARKVVGVGSVGTRTWIVLMLGNDDGDPLFLQVKESEPSVLVPTWASANSSNAGSRRGPAADAGGQRHHARLVPHAQHRRTKRGYIRQLWDGKGSAAVTAMEASAMAAYAELCGWTLAHARARSADAVAISAYPDRVPDIEPSGLRRSSGPRLIDILRS